MNGDQINVIRVIDELRKLTPADVQTAIDDSLRIMAEIKKRAKAELAVERAQLAKLRRVAKMLGTTPTANRRNGTGKAIETTEGTEHTDDGSPRPVGPPQKLSDRMAEYLADRGACLVDSVAVALGVPPRAVQVAAARSAKLRYVGNKVYWH